MLVNTLNSLFICLPFRKSVSIINLYFLLFLLTSSNTFIGFTHFLSSKISSPLGGGLQLAVISVSLCSNEVLRRLPKYEAVNAELLSHRGEGPADTA